MKGFKDKHHVACPAMPVRDGFKPEHRPLIRRHVFPAMVARPVPKSEMFASEAATKAMRDEWDRLWDKCVWASTDIREWEVVAKMARQGGQNIHMARIFGICVEKNAELPPGSPGRKFKYRVVFGGNQVITQNWEQAQFLDQGSSPASQEVGKPCDAYGCYPGHLCQMSDAEQAYVQAELTGPPTWICIPEELSLIHI